MMLQQVLGFIKLVHYRDNVFRSTVTFHSSAFQGTKIFYDLEWKCLGANIESIIKSDQRVFLKCLIGEHCLIGECLRAGFHCIRYRLHKTHLVIACYLIKIDIILCEY